VQLQDARLRQQSSGDARATGPKARKALVLFSTLDMVPILFEGESAEISHNIAQERQVLFEDVSAVQGCSGWSVAR
jgi:hypothetical protein